MRSVRRDLAALRDIGVPVEGDAGRGGGVRLAPRWAFGQLALGSEEAVDMLLALALAERLDSPLLLDRLRGIRQKLAAGLGQGAAHRVRDLRERILIGAPASAQVVTGYTRPAPAVTAVVKHAFLEMRRLRIDYRDEAGRPSAREVEPQFLYYNAPVWYLLAWDRLRADVRTFRIDRIEGAEMLVAGFRRRDAARFLAQGEAEAAHP